MSRINILRIEAEKENNNLRSEIRRLKEFNDKQKQNVSGNICEGIKKTDGVSQTEYLNIENKQTDEYENYSWVNETEKQNFRRESLSKSNFINNQDDFVKEILNHFQSLQINVTLPVFDGLKKSV